MLVPFYRWGEWRHRRLRGGLRLPRQKNMEASFLLSHLLLWPTLCPSSLGLFLARERERVCVSVCVCVCILDLEGL